MVVVRHYRVVSKDAYAAPEWPCLSASLHTSACGRHCRFGPAIIWEDDRGQRWKCERGKRRTWHLWIKLLGMTSHWQKRTKLHNMTMQDITQMDKFHDLTLRDMTVADKTCRKLCGMTLQDMLLQDKVCLKRCSRSALSCPAILSTSATSCNVTPSNFLCPSFSCPAFIVDL